MKSNSYDFNILLQQDYGFTYYLLGVFHFYFLLLYTYLYPIISLTYEVNPVWDYIYLGYVGIVLIGWLVFRGECFIGLWIKKKINPDYPLYENIDCPDYDYFLKNLKLDKLKYKNKNKNSQDQAPKTFLFYYLFEVISILILTFLILVKTISNIYLLSLGILLVLGIGLIDFYYMYLQYRKELEVRKTN